MKKVNVYMVVQWVIFSPIIIPISLITGAYNGLKATFSQAISDIFHSEEISSN